MWYAIWVTTGQEETMQRVLSQNLPTESNSSCFAPTKVEKRKVRGDMEEVEKALFPGYIFLESDAPMETYLDLKTIPLFKVMLKSGDDFAPLAPAEEAILKQLLGEDKRVDVSIGTMEEGKLKILSGPIKGMEKYIIRVDKHKRKAFLQMQMLGKVVEYNVALELV